MSDFNDGIGFGVFSVVLIWAGLTLVLAQLQFKNIDKGYIEYWGNRYIIEKVQERQWVDVIQDDLVQT